MQPGFWIAATALDGVVVLPPTHVDSPIDRPAAIAVNGDRVFVGGGNIVHVLDLAGVPVAAPRALFCPDATGCVGWRFLPGPGDGVRVVWLRTDRSSWAQVVDRDGRIAGPASAGPEVTTPISLAPDGTAYAGISQRASVNGCNACTRAYVYSVTPDAQFVSLGTVTEPSTIASGQASVTHDGTHLYASWSYGDPVNSPVRGLHVGRFPGPPTFELLQGGSSLIVATAAGTGALFYRLAGTTKLTRFRDQAGVTVSAAVQDVPEPLTAQGLPFYAYAADVDHVVTLNATGLAQCWTLP